MNNITCEICKDLMPLVKDGIASEDSKIAVEEHIVECETCKALYDSSVQDSVVNPDFELELGKLKKRLQIFSAMLLNLRNTVQQFSSLIILKRKGFL